jgi:hypothetical protein
MPREKRPGLYKGAARGWVGMPAWADFATKEVEDWRLAQWMQWPEANVGLLHTAEFIAVDFDNDFAGCHAEIKELLAVIPGVVVRRQGKPSTYVQYFRADGDIKSSVYRVEDGNLLEVLALGRQSVAVGSVHPLGFTYVYVTPDTLDDTAISDLPLLDAATMAKIEDILRRHGWTEKATRGVGGGHAGDHASSGNGGSGLWGEVNRRAMAGLDAWVPALDIANLERTRKGWQGTAQWRPGGSGNPVHKRKRNLFIDANLCHDYGDARTYSPIDLVAASRGTDADDALMWLMQRVGPHLPPWQPKRLREAGAAL